MTARASLAAVLFATAGITAFASPAQDRPSEPGVRVRLPETVDLTGLQIRYFVTGPWGGFGSFVRPGPDRYVYRIETPDDRPPDGVSIAVYSPGHRIVLIKERGVPEAPNRVLDVPLEPLASLPLRGRVLGLPDPTDLKLEVVYQALWGHRFFGIADGAVLTFEVASAAVNRDGSFTTRVPDFANDPAVSQWPEGIRGRLRLRLRQRGTGNVPYAVELVERAASPAEIPISRAYHDELLLVPVRR